jgi:hypothetical protein
MSSKSFQSNVGEQMLPDMAITREIDSKKTKKKHYAYFYQFEILQFH